jgi:predicted nucleic acid-binding protein
MIVVADTSPLNYLAILERLDLLPTLYEQVVIPVQVAGELRAALNVPATRSLAISPPPWLRVQHVTPDPSLLHLDAGEQAAITLAEAMRAEILLCDDLRGRRAAERRSITVTGTIGILQLAAIGQLIDFHDTVKRLTATTNFRVRQEILDRAAKAIRSPDPG